MPQRLDSNGRSFFLKIQSSTIALVMIGLATAGAVLVSVFAPDLDVEIANRLFDPVAKHFPAASQLTLARLRGQGYVIVARNYRSTAGGAEADLIAWEGATLVVVEVKSRHSDEHGPPERAIGDDKRAHLRRVARSYARKTDTPWEKVRCDVVTVVLTGRPALQLVRNAFSI